MSPVPRPIPLPQRGARIALLSLGLAFVSCSDDEGAQTTGCDAYEVDGHDCPNAGCANTAAAGFTAFCDIGDECAVVRIECAEGCIESVIERMRCDSCTGDCG